MLLNTPKLDIINSFSGNVWPYFGCMHKVCMRTQKYFSLRAFRINLFLWMWTSQNKIPIFIRNMTWYEGTTFTSHSTKFVAAWTRNCISRKKEIKVIITIKFFTCTVALLIRTFHRAWQNKLVIDFFFCKTITTPQQPYHRKRGRRCFLKIQHIHEQSLFSLSYGSS